MKTLYATGAACVLLAGAPSLTQAWEAGGYVVCDANQNQDIDSEDVGLSGVLVVVTNTSGSFSNANWSATEGGGYAVQLPPNADSYVAYLHPDTLPMDATIVLPPAAYFSFTLDGVTQSNFMGSFLVSSALCTNLPPEEPGTNDCCVAGMAKMGGTKYCPEFIVAGALRSGDECGEWEVLALLLKLRFEAKAIEVIDCGVMQEGQPDEWRYIEFEGVGSLKEIAKSKNDYGLVYFWARIEDHNGENGTTDKVYFRAYAEDGTTLMLISDDTDNPLNIAPVAVTYGGFAVGVNDCDFDKPDKKHKKKDDGRGKHKDDKGDKGKGKAKGKDKNKDQGKGNGKDDGNKEDKDQDKGKSAKSDNSKKSAKSGKSNGKKY